MSNFFKNLLSRHAIRHNYWVEDDVIIDFEHTLYKLALSDDNNSDLYFL